MSDWYDKQICHLPNLEVDRTNGRIFKISHKDAFGEGRRREGNVVRIGEVPGNTRTNGTPHGAADHAVQAENKGLDPA